MRAQTRRGQESRENTAFPPQPSAGIDTVDELLAQAPPGCRPLHLHRYGNTYGTAFIVPIEQPGKPGVPDWKHTSVCDSNRCLRLVGIPPALFAEFVLGSLTREREE